MHLSAKAIEAMAGERRVHFINPNAIRIDKSLGDAVGLKNLGVHLMTVAPGERSTELHRHRYEDEAIYVLSGQGTAVVGDASYRIAPGDFLGFPGGGAAHETINDGTDPLVCLVMGQRLAQDVVDYPRAGKRLYRNSGQRDSVDIADVRGR
jgi:uncharacterized cupin superfamily protein